MEFGIVGWLVGCFPMTEAETAETVETENMAHTQPLLYVALQALLIAIATTLTLTQLIPFTNQHFIPHTIAWTILAIDILYLIHTLYTYKHYYEAIRTFILALQVATAFSWAMFFVILGDMRALQFSVYIVFVSAFHFLEFMMTAINHPETVSANSFLLSHSPEYLAAVAAATIEFWIEFFLIPSIKNIWILILLGAFICFCGQSIRTLAMWQAGRNFTHLVASTKKTSHVLITTGIYSFLRHPSYFGWFWWSISTQIVLSNPICFLGYSFMSWKFFASRIPYEEERLRVFFGQEYDDYRKRVGICIPFIPQ